MTDSSDFESADEGFGSSKKNKPKTKASKDADGWEDEEWGDLDAEEPQKPSEEKPVKQIVKESPKAAADNEGWGDWNDEDEDVVQDEGKNDSTVQERSTKDFQEIADRLSSLGERNEAKSSENQGGWGGWGGWGVTSLLTSGVSQLTSHVSQGFASVSQVIESGMNIPDPAELAKLQKSKSEERESSPNEEKNVNLTSRKASEDKAESESQNDDMLGVFKIGKIVSNVSKLVETTGTAVVTGGIDTLEEIGKRTMRVLQGEDEGKKRLSTLLREARQYTEQRPSNEETTEVATKKKAPQFEALFDDFQGLVHLEALEMLSKQCDMKIQSLLKTHEGDELNELKETLEQVKEICDLPEPDDDEKDYNLNNLNSSTLKTNLLESVKDMGVNLQFDQIIESWEKIIAKLNDNVEEFKELEEEEARESKFIETAEDIRIEAITNIAQCSALSVQVLHRCTALLSVRERRSTADEADGLTQLTTILTSHISEVAALYSQKLNKISQLCDKNASKISELITSVFLEAGKGSTYVQDAFALTIPILQVGAT